MPCESVKVCACPKKICRYNAKCCDCISFHLREGEKDYLPYCLFPHSDKSMESVYHKLKERYEGNQEESMQDKTKVAFICVHNSCRSQIAEALCRHLAGDIFDCYSAGTEIKPQINQDAVRLMKQLYDVDMEKTQYSKLLNDIPPVDIVITMGCNVACPYLPCRRREDWGLDDPTGKCDEEFIKVIKTIEEKILLLKNG